MANLNDNRGILTVLRPALNLDNLPLLIFVNKGIEVGTNALTLEIIVDTCGSDVAKAATFIVQTLFLSNLQWTDSRFCSRVLLSQKKVREPRKQGVHSPLKIDYSRFEAAHFCFRSLIYRRRGCEGH